MPNRTTLSTCPTSASQCHTAATRTRTAKRNRQHHPLLADSLGSLSSEQGTQRVERLHDTSSRHLAAFVLRRGGPRRRRLPAGARRSPFPYLAGECGKTLGARLLWSSQLPVDPTLPDRTDGSPSLRCRDYKRGRLGPQWNSLEVRRAVLFPVQYQRPRCAAFGTSRTMSRTTDRVISGADVGHRVASGGVREERHFPDAPRNVGGSVTGDVLSGTVAPGVLRS